MTAVLVVHVAAGCGDGGGGQDGGADPTDLIEDESGDADSDATDTHGDETGDVDRDPTDVHVEVDGDPGRECPEMPWECPDYLTEGGMFCDGDDLYSGGIACDPDCGCSCLSDFIEHCDAGCDDPEDGSAHCN
jgi:hypothetical protein